MKDEIQKELLNRVDMLAEKLGVAAGHLWGVLVRQAYVEAVLGLIFLALCVVGVRVLIWYGSLVHKKTSDREWDDDAWLPFVMVAIFGGISIFIIGAMSIENITNGFLNPEYAAFKKLADVIGK